MKINQIFSEITGFNPYNFQLEAIDLLSNGNSLILMAPTGSGKSEVVLISFLLNKNWTLPSQMIYSLPTRALIENLSKRAQKYASFKGFSTAFHYGNRVESELFEEDIILTTIDQTIGAYVCAPLSAPIKRGNILAGAVSSAFLVFDEIHTFDPNRGLQTAITLIEHSSKLRLPFAVMSATLPDLLINKIKKIIGKQAKIVKVEDEIEIKSRKNRKVILHTKPLKESKKLSINDILELYNSSKDKKLIVICNMVEKAQQIYQDLMRTGKIDARILLIHSRFLDEDRKKKEELLQKLFSRESREHVILISTQVIEVGMDISSNMMITEVAPIDSLIQRAGRCARWGGSGDFYIYDVEEYKPYEKNLVEKTKEEIIKFDGEQLTWNLERKLVNDILSNYYQAILDDAKRAKIIGTLARALFEGDRSKVEETVRDAHTCTVSIHNNPEELCNENNDILKLQKVNVNVCVFRSKVKKLLENGISIWSIEESNILDDYTFRFSPSVITSSNEILPYKHYVVSPDGADYNEDTGLVFGIKSSKKFNLIEKETLEKREIELFYRKHESWIDHANNVLEVLDTFFIPRYIFAIKKFSEAFGTDKEDLIEKIRFAVALHDLGKLNRDWQDKVKWDGKIPLAHSDKVEITRIGIPHATVSSYALSYLCDDWGVVGYPLLLAIAHHHSPRSQEYKSYKFIDRWKNIIETLPVFIDTEKIIYKKKISDRLGINMPYLDYENNILPYRFYTFISKVLRLSDWVATSGDAKWSIM